MMPLSSTAYLIQSKLFSSSSALPKFGVKHEVPPSTETYQTLSRGWERNTSQYQPQTANNAPPGEEIDFEDQPPQRRTGFNPLHHVKEHACEYTLGGIFTLILTAIGIGVGAGGKICREINPPNAVSKVFQNLGEGFPHDPIALCPKAWLDDKGQVFKRNYPGYTFKHVGDIYSNHVVVDQGKIVGALGKEGEKNYWYDGNLLESLRLLSGNSTSTSFENWTTDFLEKAAPKFEVHPDGHIVNTVQNDGWYFPKMGKVVPVNGHTLDERDFALGGGWAGNGASSADGS